jgi:uncharacterized membrane protein YgcG
MYRSTAAAASVLSAALLTTVLSLSLSSAPAAAYDDDVDVVCFDINGGSEIECQTIEQLTAECALADPEFTTDECGGLLENRKPFGLTTSSGNKEKHRRDNDSGKGRDHNDGGGNSGGGNSGGSGPNG